MSANKEIAGARARIPVRWHWLLSHRLGENEADWDRCICVPLGPQRMLPLCARCLAIYPLAAILLVASLAGWISLDRLDGVGLWLLPLPAWADAVGDWLRWRTGCNRSRIATGLLLAPALARLFERYLHDPTDAGVWQVVCVYGLSAAVAAFLGRKCSGASSR